MPTALVDSLRTNGITLLIGTVALGAVGQFNLAWRILQVPIGLINSAISQVFFQKLARIRPGQMLPLVRGTILRSLLIPVPFGLIYLVPRDTTLCSDRSGTWRGSSPAPSPPGWRCSW